MDERTERSSKPRICFVALNAYNLLAGREDIPHVGGAEVQQVRMASWLVRRGYDVSFVTLDHGQPDGFCLDGITVRKAYAENAGIRRVRFFHPRWSGVWAAMTRANADVYYQRGAGSETGQVALWCHLHHRRFILAAASNSDCDLRLPPVKPWVERVLYRVGVRMASAITAQTVAQQDLFRRNLGLPSILIRSCGWRSVEIGAEASRPASLSGAFRVLWVGRIGEKKRFEWLLDVAERSPRVMFEVVGAPNVESPYAARLLRRAARISNVLVRGQVPYAEMAQYYQQSDLVLCTSPYEGFPNTFLEAWSLGVPVLSTFDPDGVIAARGLGWVARDVEGIVARLEEIARSPEEWRRESEAARQYYLANHTPDACLPRFERLLLDVAGVGATAT